MSLPRFSVFRQLCVVWCHTSLRYYILATCGEIFSQRVQCGISWARSRKRRALWVYASFVPHLASASYVCDLKQCAKKQLQLLRVAFFLSFFVLAGFVCAEKTTHVAKRQDGWCDTHTCCKSIHISVGTAPVERFVSHAAQRLVYTRASWRGRKRKERGEKKKSRESRKPAFLPNMLPCVSRVAGSRRARLVPPTPCVGIPLSAAV